MLSKRLQTHFFSVPPLRSTGNSRYVFVHDQNQTLQGGCPYCIVRILEISQEDARKLVRSLCDRSRIYRYEPRRRRLSTAKRTSSQKRIERFSWTAAGLLRKVPREEERKGKFSTGSINGNNNGEKIRSMNILKALPDYSPNPKLVSIK